jgi:DNA-binding transcriptional MerR regulator
LAEQAGITMRTLRFYRERKLLPPPRMRGRTAWYDDKHLARLLAINSLLARGHTLNGIAELFAAFAAGRDAGRTAEMLGLNTSPWDQEERVRLSGAELAAYYEGGATPENLTAALEMGYLAIEGGGFVYSSRDLLEASSGLVAEGIAVADILAIGRDIRVHIDALADMFTGLIRTYVLPEVLGKDSNGPLSDDDWRRLADKVQRLRPLVKKVVYAEISLATDRKIRAELEGLE